MENEVESEPEDRFYDYVHNILGENENEEEDFDAVSDFVWIVIYDIFKKDDEFYLKAYTGQLQFDPNTTQIAVSTPDAKGKLVSDDQITPGTSSIFPNLISSGSRYFIADDDASESESSDSEEEGQVYIHALLDDNPDDKKPGLNRVKFLFSTLNNPKLAILRARKRKHKVLQLPRPWSHGFSMFRRKSKNFILNY
jgi:hypothetical protein